MAFPMLLLAAQASGLGLNMYQRRKEEKYANLGADIDSKELGLQIQKEQLASSEQSLANTERLRETLSSQRALFAARGVNAGQGTARSISRKSLQAYNEDERALALSTNFRKSQLESQQRLIGISKKARASRRKTEDILGVVNLLNFNEIFGDESSSGLNSGTGKLNG